MRRREKLFWLCVGAALFLLVLSIIPSHYPICDESEKTQAKNCPSYQVAQFLWIKIPQFLDVHNWLVTALFAGLVTLFTWRLWLATNELRASTDKLWESGDKQITIGKQSADAATKSAKVADEAMFMAYRPYIFVTSAELNHALDPTTFDFSGAPISTTVDLMVENHGSTPATIMRVCADSVCIAALPVKPEYHPEAMNPPTRMVLGRDKIIRLKYKFTTPIDGQVMTDIFATPIAKRTLYAYGIIKFEDIFGNINDLGFCWRYIPSVRKFYPEDNEAYNYHDVFRPQPRDAALKS